MGAGGGYATPYCLPAIDQQPVIRMSVVNVALVRTSVLAVVAWLRRGPVELAILPLNLGWLYCEVVALQKEHASASSGNACMLSVAVCIEVAGFASALLMLLVSQVFFVCQVTADLVSRKSRKSEIFKWMSRSSWISESRREASQETPKTYTLGLL